MVIKDYNNWSYDEILDMYLDTGDSLFLSYLFIVKNNLQVVDIMEITELSLEDTFLTLYNIQRRLDGLKTADTFEEIDSLEHSEIPLDDDEENYDF